MNNGLVGVWSRANDQGAWEIGFRPLPNLSEAFKQYEAIYIAGADPVADDPSLAETLRNAGFVVVQDLFLTETARLADVVLPVQPFTEREGTYTNGERRVQRFYPGVVRNEFWPDYAVTAAICKLVGLNVESAPLRIFSKLAARVPAFKELTYPLLAQVTEQWPIVGREEVYYGGTLYANHQGLGAQLALPSQVPSLAWPALPEVNHPEDTLLAVPVTILYDHGQLVFRSTLLHQRIPQTLVRLNPADANRLGFSDGSRVKLQLNGSPLEALLNLDDGVPEGIVVVPRSLGIPLYSPSVVELQGA